MRRECEIKSIRGLQILHMVRTFLSKENTVFQYIFIDYRLETLTQRNAQLLAKIKYSILQKNYTWLHNLFRWFSFLHRKRKRIEKCVIERIGYYKYRTLYIYQYTKVVFFRRTKAANMMNKKIREKQDTNSIHTKKTEELC